jgi:hypothetical protein
MVGEVGLCEFCEEEPATIDFMWFPRCKKCDDKYFEVCETCRRVVVTAKGWPLHQCGPVDE